jgi:hypothetical protein
MTYLWENSKLHYYSKKLLIFKKRFKKYSLSQCNPIFSCHLDLLTHHFEGALKNWMWVLYCEYNPYTQKKWNHHLFEKKQVSTQFQTLWILFESTKCLRLPHRCFCNHTINGLSKFNKILTYHQFSNTNPWIEIQD